jgi:hypothetical protein
MRKGSNYSVDNDRQEPTSVSAMTRFLLGVIADPTSLDQVDNDAGDTPQADAQDAPQWPRGETA